MEDKKKISIVLHTSLIEKIEAYAKAEYMDRNAWITNIIIGKIKQLDEK